MRHAELCDGVGCDDAEWSDGPSFIQQNLQISRRVESVEALGDGERYTISREATKIVITPATDSVDVDAFGERVVDFPFWTLVSGLVFISLWTMHEFLVSQGMTPVLARDHAAINFGVQLVGCAIQMWVFLQMSMVIPLSLDFALSLNRGASASGFFVSAGVVMAILGTGVGKGLVDETRWRQSYARRLVLGAVLTVAAVEVGLGIFLNATALSSEASSIWWLSIAFAQASMFFVSLPTVTFVTFWTKLTPPEHRVFWMVIQQCSRNLGLVLGPLGYSLVQQYVTGMGPRVSPRSMMAWVHIILAACALVLLGLATVFIPSKLSDRSVISEEPLGAARADGTTHPEDLSDESRGKIVWYQVLYAFERPLTLAAVEVATLMMLEVFYGWDPYYSGIVFTFVCSFGIVVSVLSLVLVESGYLQETTLLLTAAASALVGCLFLFDTGHAKAWTLLVADAIIYTGGTTANGVSMGWALRATKPGTSFSQADYVFRNSVAVVAARFLGPIASRFLVDYFGRNTYASLQLIFCYLGTRTVYSSCRLLWESEKPASNQRQETTNCALIVPRRSTMHSASHAPEDSPNPSEPSA